MKFFLKENFKETVFITQILSLEKEKEDNNSNLNINYRLAEHSKEHQAMEQIMQIKAIQSKLKGLH